MKILVRLPNWLGDMVMSIPFLEQLKKEYPEASVSMIAKKELESLLQYFLDYFSTWDGLHVDLHLCFLSHLFRSYILKIFISANGLTKAGEKFFYTATSHFSHLIC